MCISKWLTKPGHQEMRHRMAKFRMRKEKIQVRSLNGGGIRIWGAKDKGLPRKRGFGRRFGQMADTEHDRPDCPGFAKRV